METLIVHVPGRSARGPSMARYDSAPVGLGRSLRNDIVLDDPYVAAEQLRFVRRDAQWFVEVLDRTNPVLLNGDPLHEDIHALQSGDQLTVGRTDLSVFDAAHPVDPPRRLAYSSWLSARRVSPWLALLVLIGGSAFDAASEYWLTATSGKWHAYATGGLFAAALTAAWAALWALLGRLVRHQAHYFAHLLVTSLVGTGLTVLMGVPLLVEFATSNATVTEAGNYLAAVIGLSLLLGFNLFLATHLQRTARVALVFSVCIVTLFYVGDHRGDDSFEAKPSYSRLVLPPLLHVTGERSVEQFIAHAPVAPDPD